MLSSSSNLLYRSLREVLHFMVRPPVCITPRCWFRVAVAAADIAGMCSSLHCFSDLCTAGDAQQ